MSEECENVSTLNETLRKLGALRAENERLRGLLRELVDGDHIYGNDSERVLVKIEAALAGGTP